MRDQVVDAVYGVGTNRLDEYAYYYDLSKEDYSNLEKIEVQEYDPFGGPYMRNKRAMLSGAKLKEDFIPKSVKKNGPKRPAMADYDTMFDMALVSEKFKTIVEALELGVHQFVPVEVKWSDGTLLEGQFYWFIVCNSIDSLSLTETTSTFTEEFSKKHNRIVRGFWDPRSKKGVKPKFVFDTSRLNGVHFFRDKYLVSGPFCSGVFKKKCEEAGLKGISFGDVPMETV